jgi:hypothetical protein
MIFSDRVVELKHFIEPTQAECLYILGKSLERMPISSSVIS